MRVNERLLGDVVGGGRRAGDRRPMSRWPEDEATTASGPTSDLRSGSSCRPRGGARETEFKSSGRCWRAAARSEAQRRAARDAALGARRTISRAQDSGRPRPGLGVRERRWRSPTAKVPQQAESPTSKAPRRREGDLLLLVADKRPVHRRRAGQMRLDLRGRFGPDRRERGRLSGSSLPVAGVNDGGGWDAMHHR